MLLSEKMKFLGEMFTFAVFFFPLQITALDLEKEVSFTCFHFVAQAGLEITS